MLDLPPLGANPPEPDAAAFPALAEALAHPLERRRALRLMGASAALAALGGCDPAAPDGQWVPAVIAAPGIVAGRAKHYATAQVGADGSALGIVVTHAMGRPIKVEGNPDHPSSLGATNAAAQAMILDFYDPDRSGAIRHGEEISEAQSLLTALSIQREHWAATRGAGLRILTGPTTSPTLTAAIGAVIARYPMARWHQWEPISSDGAVAGSLLAYGRRLVTVPRLDQVDVLVGLDSDLLDGAPGHVRFARDVASRRNPVRGPMSRVYAAEPAPTLLGTLADHRLAARPDTLHAVTMALAATLLQGAAPPQDAPAWAVAVAADLLGARGRAFIHAGPELPSETHALVHAMNEALSGRGRTYTLIETPWIGASGLEELRDDMTAGRVDSLVMLDSNPAQTAPGFAEAMAGVAFTLSLSPLFDETAAAAHWWLPQAHAFETWADARAHDGTATVLQPQTLPLYGGRDPLILLSLLTQASAIAARDAVERTWRATLADDDAWHAALASGVVPGTASAPSNVALRAEARSATPRPPRALAGGAVRVLYRPDPHLGDGRLANNAWLQELPRPLTKVVWDNPVLISPAMARAYGIANSDEVTLEAGGRRVAAPAWVVPGIAPDCAVAILGYGRGEAGSIGTGVGVDFYPLRTAGTQATLTRTGKTHAVASTDRRAPDAGDTSEFLHRLTLAAFQQGARPDSENPPESELLYRRKPSAPVQWGMSIDLNACIGCNACVVACQAENNIPVVGRENVIHQREMHWLRIDRYETGSPDAPETDFQPMLCQHCEQAPCEVVCPVGATQHDSEGLNVMTYNRCVGTRFCSNNCPYKVRRFNYAAYAQDEHRPSIARNPDVSVRTRGVMEKCTFCVQRIAEARIAADRDGVPEQAVTACQAACPTRAFTFGDINDAHSDVVARKASPLDFPALPKESTFPRVTYEARVRNLNPALKA